MQAYADREREASAGGAKPQRPNLHRGGYYMGLIGDYRTADGKPGQKPSCAATDAKQVWGPGV